MFGLQVNFIFSFIQQAQKVITFHYVMNSKLLELQKYITFSIKKQVIPCRGLGLLGSVLA